MIYLKLTDSGTDYYQRQWAIFLSQIISKCLMRWCGRDSITGLGTGISEVRCLPFSTFILRNHLTSLSISVHRILVSLVPSWESLTWPVYSLPWVGWSVSLPTGHACDSYQSNKQLQNGAEASVTKRVSLSQIAIFFFFFFTFGHTMQHAALRFLTGDRTHVRCSGMWNLNHWTAREVLAC